MKKKTTTQIWIDAYFYGCMLAGMFLWLFTIGVAATNDWIIVLDFNNYGEGAAEYLLMLMWLMIACAKGVKLFLELKYDTMREM